MRALLVAVGTRGDVQPALALGVALKEIGHSVRLCLSPNFVDRAASLGLEAVPMGVEMRLPAKQSGGPPKYTPEELRRLRESMPDLIADQFETVGRAVENCDVIVGANAHQYAAPSIAERAGIGCITAVYAPNSLPSSELAPPAAAGRSRRRIDVDERRRSVAHDGPVLERPRARADQRESRRPRNAADRRRARLCLDRPGLPPMLRSRRRPRHRAGRFFRRGPGCLPIPRRCPRKS